MPKLEVDAPQLKATGVLLALPGVAVRLVGAVGGGVVGGVLKATICITQRPAGLSGAVALWLPVAVTFLSSATSASGEVSTRWVNPVPVPDPVETVLAPRMRSV